MFTAVRTYHLYSIYQEDLTYYCTTDRKIENAIMEYHFRIFFLILGMMGFMNCVMCITEEEIDKIVGRKMEKVIKKYDRKIALLEEKMHAQDVKIQNLEKKCSTTTSDAEEERENAPLHVSSNRGNDTGTKRNSYVSGSHAHQTKIVGGDPGLVAFCADMTTRETSPSLHHNLVFNYVKTNLGSAYNSISGMFTAPADGVYVFSWTIVSEPHSYIYTQIVVNSIAFNSMITDSEHVSETHSSTKVIVVSLNRGDLVYVRTHPTALSHGNINSQSQYDQPSFCGWKL